MDGGLVIAASRTEQWARRPHAIWRWLGRSAIAGLAASVAIALASDLVAAASASAAVSVPPSPGVTDPVPPSPGVAAAVRGPEQTVFDWASQRCPDYRLPHVTGTDGAIVRDMPDAPARAYRTADGQVTLIASGRVTRRMVGPDLDHLKRDCTPVLVSPYLGTDASSYAMRLWMYSPYTPDGTHIYALLHTEYHGDSNLPATPQNCPSGDRLLCWYDAVTMAASTNDGSHFGLAPRPPMSTPGPQPPESFVASIPYVYNPTANAAVGYFETSNIVNRDGYYYVLMTALDYRAQQRGTCLMRT